MVWLACGYGLALPASNSGTQKVDQPRLDKVIDAYFDSDS